MNIEKMFDPNSYTEKAMPVMSAIFASLEINGKSDQRKQLSEKNKELHEKRIAIFKELSPEQRDIVNDDDDIEMELHAMELSETFSCGCKLGAMLMLELLGKGGELK